MPEADAAVAAIAAFASAATLETMPPLMLSGYRDRIVDATAALLSTAGDGALRRTIDAARGALGPAGPSEDAASPMLDAFSSACRLASTSLWTSGPATGGLFGIVALAGSLAASRNLAGGTTGCELLVATALGCEVQLRLEGRAAESTRGVWRLDQLLGTFGTAVAAGRTLGLDAPGMESAVGIALTLASGTVQSMATAAPLAYLGNGFSALSGVWAAVQAAHGVGARYAALSGPFGLFPLWFGLEGPGKNLDGLGANFWSAALVGEGNWSRITIAERLRGAAPHVDGRLVEALGSQLEQLETLEELETLRGLLDRALA